MTALLADGTPKMLSHFGDEANGNTGFLISSLGATIRGSFPSPDDLMNITPLLDEELAASSLVTYRANCSTCRICCC